MAYNPNTMTPGAYGSQFDAEEVEVEAPNLSLASSYFVDPKWYEAKQGERPVDKVFQGILSNLEKDKEAKVKWKNSEGEVIDAPIWNRDGSMNIAGKEHLQKQRMLLENGNQSPDAGLYYNSLKNTIKPADWTNQFNDKSLSDLQGPPRLPSSDEYFSESAVIDDGKGATYEGYINYVNGLPGNKGAQLDVDNEDLRADFDKLKKFNEYDPKAYGSDKALHKVGDSWIINPEKAGDYDQVQKSINENEDLSLIDKKLLKMQHDEQFEKIGLELVNNNAVADAGFWKGTVFGQFNLRDEFLEHMNDPTATFKQFYQENKDRFDETQRGWISEIATKTSLALVDMGAGVVALPGMALEKVGVKGAAGFMGEPSAQWAAYGEAASKGYDDYTLLSVAGIDINRSDLTSLSGQVFSFIITGGIGSSAAKGLSLIPKMAKFTRYAPGFAGKALAAQQALIGAGKLKKLTAFGKAALTDHTAYLGASQAASMSYGRTFNEGISAGLTREEAIAGATNAGLSNGLSAFIATSVMNRFGLGAEKAFGSQGANAGILAQNQARLITKEGRKSVVEMLESLSLKGSTVGIRNSIMDSMGEVRKQFGLKGRGFVDDIASEAIEETTDELLSTAIGAMLDDSKTWTDDVWGNIATNWRDYVKAGILGAAGGAMGASVGTISSPIESFSPNGSQATKERLDKIRHGFEVFKVSKEEFSTRQTAQTNVAGDVMNVAEVLADPNLSDKKKGEILVSAAMQKVAEFDSLIQDVDAAPESESKSKQDEKPTPTPEQVAERDKAQSNSRTKIGEAINFLGATPREGRQPNENVLVLPMLKPEKPLKTQDGGTLMPLSVGPAGPYQAAEYTNAQGQTEVVSPARAMELLGGKKTKTPAYKGFEKNSKLTQIEKDNLYDEWTETSTSPADNGQVPKAGKRADGVDKNDSEAERNSQAPVTGKAEQEGRNEPIQSPVEKGEASDGSVKGAAPATSELRKSTPISAKDKQISAPLAKALGDVVFEKPDGSRYTTEDIKNTDPVWHEQKGATVSIPDYEQSNEAGGFKLTETPYNEKSHSRLKYNPSDTIYNATDHTGRSFAISATALQRQGAKVISPSNNNSKAEAPNSNTPTSTETEAAKKDRSKTDPIETVISRIAPANQKATILKLLKEIPKLEIWLRGIDRLGAKLNIETEGSTLGEYNPETNTVNINLKALKKLSDSNQKIYEAFVHEIIHASQQSDQAWSLVTQKMVNDLVNDPELEAFMIKEYSGYSELSGIQKFLEASRAIAEGKYLLNETSSVFESFKKYFADFFKHLEGILGSQPELQEYIDSAAKALGIDPSELTATTETTNENKNETETENTAKTENKGEPRQAEKVRPQREVAKLNKGQVKQHLGKFGDNAKSNTETRKERDTGTENIWFAEGSDIDGFEISEDFLNELHAKHLGEDNAADLIQSEIFRELNKAYLVVTKKYGAIETTNAFSKYAEVEDGKLVPGEEVRHLKRKGFILNAAKSTKESREKESRDAVSEEAREEASVIITRKKFEQESEDGSGGKWSAEKGSKTGPRYFRYKPAAKKELKLDLGDRIVIVDNLGPEGQVESVLALVGFVNGEYRFMEYSLKSLERFSGLSKSKGSQIGLEGFNNKKWNQSKLDSLDAGIFKTIKDLLIKNDTSTASRKKVFNAIMKIVSPNIDLDSIVHKDMKGTDSFFYVGGDAIHVDLKKLFEEVMSSHDLVARSTSTAQESAINDQMVALDIARRIATLAGEESSHLIALRIFEDSEIRILYEAMMSLDKNHMLRTLLTDTVEELFPGVDPMTTAAENSISLEENSIVIAGHEFLRKVLQLRLTGESSEMAAMQSRELAYALRTGEGVFKALGTMIRRYAHRLFTILRTRRALKGLDASSQAKMNKLKAALDSEGIQLDFDQIKDKLNFDQKTKAEAYINEMESTINDRSINHFEGIQMLKSIPETYGFNIKAEELIDLDDDGNLVLHKKVEEHLSRYRNDEIDLDKIKAALVELNEGAVGEDTSFGNQSSFRLSQDRVLMMRELMDSRLEDLTFNPTSLLQSISRVVRGDVVSEAGINRKELFVSLIADARSRLDENSKTQDPIAELYDSLAANMDSLASEVETARNRALNYEIGALQELDTESKAGRKSIFSLARKMKLLSSDQIKEALELADQSSIKLAESMQAEVLSAISFFKDRGKLAEAYEQISRVDFGEEHSKGRAELTEALTLAQSNLADNEAFTNAIKNSSALKVKRVETETGANTISVSYEDSASGRSLKAFLDENQSDTELDAADSFTVEENVNTKYKQLVEFIKATNEYNKEARNLRKMALGDFFINSEGYGLTWSDSRKTNESGEVIRFGKKDTVPEANTSEEVHGYYNLPPEQSVKKEHIPGATHPRTVPRFNKAFRDGNSKNPDGSDVIVIPKETSDAFEAHKSLIESNAGMWGRTSRERLLVAESKGELLVGTNSDTYSKTGGYNLSLDSSPNLATPEYESPESAFNRYSSVDRIGIFHRDIFFSDPDTKFESDRVLELVDAVNGVTDWVSDIRSKISGPDFRDSIGSVIPETLAGREAKLLGPLLDNLVKEDGTESSYLSEYKSNLKSIVADNFSQKRVNGEVKLIPKNASTLDSATENFINQYKKFYNNDNNLGFAGSKFRLLKEAVQQANTAVHLARHSLRQFQNPIWEKNLMTEISRKERDPAYVSTNPVILALGDSESDIRVYRNLSFFISYSEKYSNYRVSSLLAGDILSTRPSYGEGTMPTINVQDADIKRGLTEVTREFAMKFFRDKQRRKSDKSLNNKADRYKTPKIVQGNDGKYYLQARTRVDSELSPEERTVSAINNEYDGGDARKSGPETLYSWMNDLLPNSELGGDPDSKSTAYERALRSEGKFRSRLNMWKSTNTLIIGAKQADGSLSLEAAKEFRMNAMDMEANLATPKKLGSFLRQGIIALFNEKFSGVKEQDNKALAPILNDFLEKNPHYKPLLKNTGNVRRSIDLETLISELAEFRQQVDLQIVRDAEVTDKTDVSAAFATVFKSVFDQFEAIKKSRLANDGEGKNFDDDYLPKDLTEFMQKLRPNLSKESAKKLENNYADFVDKSEASLRAGDYRRGINNGNIDDNLAIAKMLDSVMTNLDSDRPIMNTRTLYREKGLPDGGVEAAYVSDNPLVSITLQTLPNLSQNENGNTVKQETFIFAPDQTELRRAGILDFSTKFFPGVNGAPNVIFSPQVQNAPKNGSGDYLSFANGLISHVIQNPEGILQIQQMADKIRNSLDNTFLIERMVRQIDGRLENDIEFVSDVSNPEQAIELNQKGLSSEITKSAESILDGMPETKSWSASQRLKGMKVITAHLSNLALASDSHAYTAELIPSLNFEGDSTLASDINLIAKLVTDPSFKSLFDLGYIGLDTRNDYGLPATSKSMIVDGVRGILSNYAGQDITAQGESFNAGESQIADNQISLGMDGQLDEAMDKAIDEEGDSQTAREDELAISKFSGNLNEMSAEEVNADLQARLASGISGNGRSMASPLLVNIEIMAANLGLTPKQIQDKYREDGFVLPSDIAIENFFSAFISTAKKYNDEMTNEERDRQNNDSRRNGRTTLDSSYESAPIIGSTNQSKKPNQIYVGDPKKLTIPSVNGTTSLASAMNFTRKRSQMATAIGSLPMFSDKVFYAEEGGQVDLDVPLTSEVMQNLSESYKRFDFNGASEQEYDLLNKLEFNFETLDKSKNELGEQIKELKSLPSQIFLLRQKNMDEAQALKEAKRLAANYAKNYKNKSGVNQWNAKRAKLQIEEAIKEMLTSPEVSYSKLIPLIVDEANLQSEKVRNQITDSLYDFVSELGDMTDSQKESLSTTKYKAGLYYSKFLKEDTDFNRHMDNTRASWDYVYGLINSSWRESDQQQERIAKGIEAYNRSVNLANRRISVALGKTLSHTYVLGSIPKMRQLKIGMLTAKDGETNWTAESFVEASNRKLGLADTRYAEKVLTRSLKESFISQNIRETLRGFPTGKLRGDNELGSMLKNIATIGNVSKESLRSVVDRAFENQSESNLDQLGISSVSDLVNDLVLTSEDITRLIEDGSTTQEQLQQVREAEAKFKELQKDSDELQEAMWREWGRFPTNGTVSNDRHIAHLNSLSKDAIGRYSYRKLGAEKGTGFNVTLTAPSTYREDFESKESFDERKEEWFENEEVRKDYVSKRNATMALMEEMSNERVDEVYKRLRGSKENQLSFDPAAVLEQASDVIKAEDAIIDDMVNRFKDDYDQDQLLETSIKSLAYATDPRFGNELYDLSSIMKKMSFIEDLPMDQQLSARKHLVSKKEATLKRIRLTDDFNERVDVIGSVLRTTHGSISLVPKTAREQLIKQYPSINSGNVNRSISNLVLHAQTSQQKDNGKATARQMMDFPVEYKSQMLEEGFEHDGRDLETIANIDEKDRTRENVAAAYKTLLSSKMKGFLSMSMNVGKVGGRKVDDQIKIKDSSTDAILNFYSTLVEKLIYALDHPEIKKNPSVRDKIKEMLESIETFKVDRGDDAGASARQSVKTDLNIHEVFAQVIAVVEGPRIMQQFDSGLVNIRRGHGMNTLKLGAMKYLHHQDARIRMRFAHKLAAQEMAIELQALIEEGFDGKTGRERHQIRAQERKERIADAADKMGNNSLDAGAAYVVAMLRGLRNGSQSTTYYSAKQWYTSFLDGKRHLESLDSSQKSQIKVMGPIVDYFQTQQIDSIREIPVIDVIDQALRDSGLMEALFVAEAQQAKSALSASKTQEMYETQEKIIEDALVAAEKEILKLTNKDKKAEVLGYVDTLYNEFNDLYHATHLALALGSNDGRNGRAEIESTKTSIGSVPLRRGYAANPLFEGKSHPEGDYKNDPEDIMSMNEGPFFGSMARFDDQVDSQAVLRPLSMNGLKVPTSMVEDSEYRLNVQPNYQIIRRLIGRVEERNGVPRIQVDTLTPAQISKIEDRDENDDQVEGGYTQDVKPWFLEMFQSTEVVKGVLGIDIESSPNPKIASIDTEIRMQNFEVALASVAAEIENNIQNDSQIGVINTGFSEAMRFASSLFVVRALASMMQWWNQGAGPVIGYVAKKTLTGNPGDAADFLKTLVKLLGSATAGAANDLMRKPPNENSFWNQSTNFIKRTSPFVFYRAAEGHDVQRNIIRNQVRYGKGKVSNVLGLGAKKYEDLGERALSFTIGKPERLLSKAIYMTELKSKMKSRFGLEFNSDRDLMGMDEGDIPSLAKQYARIMVTDMMGQSDQAKKSMLFQSRSRAPLESALIRNIARFSTHTATTSSNMSVMIPMMWQAKDSETRRAAAENVIGTLTQNILFNMMKIHTLVPLTLWMFAKMFGDDDEDAAVWAQRKANELLEPEGQGVWGDAWRSMLLGQNRQLLPEKKSRKAAKASAKAKLSQLALIEAGQGIPYVGVFFGYSLFQELSLEPFTRKAMQQAFAKMNGLRPEAAWYEKNSVGIQSYPTSVFEDVLDTTAPTAVMLDGYEALHLTAKGMLDRRASISKDVFPAVVSQILPIFREWRSKENNDLRKLTNDR